MCEDHKKRTIMPKHWKNNAQTLYLLNEQDKTAHLISTSVSSRKIESKASENDQKIGKKNGKNLVKSGQPFFKKKIASFAMITFDAKRTPPPLLPEDSES